MNQNNEFTVGVDVGNAETKSSHKDFVSGFKVYSKLPFGCSPDSYILFNGKYYVLTQEKFPYVEDKTKDEKMFILTLIAIAKEIYFVMENRYKNDEHTLERIRQGISDVKNVNLGVGLPPSHVAMQKDDVKNYYKEMCGAGEISYEYNGMTFSYRIGNIGIFPQNYAVVASTNQNEKSSIIVKDVDNGFYTLDFGGYTLDKIAIINGKLDISQCDSMSKGIVTLCDQLIAQLRNDKGINLTETYVINILKGKKVMVGDDVVNAVKEYAKQWTFEVLDALTQSGVEFKLYPVVFMGGTSLLLREFIEQYPLLKEHEFITDSHANAEAYRKLMKSGKGR